MKTSVLVALLLMLCSPVFADDDLTYVTFLEPCRIIDTRLGGGSLITGLARDFKVAGTTGFEAQGGKAGGCGVPVEAAAALINFVAVNPQGGGNLRAVAFPGPFPTAGSIINYQLLTPNLNIANAVQFPICDHASGPCEFDITVQPNGAGVHLVADVIGFFLKDHKHEGEDITTGTINEQRVDPAIARDVEILPEVLAADGAGSGLDADLLDGNEANAFASASHNHDASYAALSHVHAGEQITSGTVADAQIAATLTRDNEVVSIVLANDGPASTLNADFLDSLNSSAFSQTTHNHDALYERKYARTVIVRSGGTALQNGAALVAALAAITGTSFTNEFLVKIEPGTYDLGASQLQMRSDVYLEGSGIGLTTITRGGGATADAAATVRGAIRSGLSFLSIANTGGDLFSVGVFNDLGESSLSNLNVRASGGSSENIGISSTVSLKSVDVAASGTGTSVNTAILNPLLTLTITDSIIGAGGGSEARGIIHTGSAGLTLNNVKLSVSGGTGPSIGVSATGFTTTVTDSDIVVSSGSGTRTGMHLTTGGLTMESSTMFISAGPAIDEAIRFDAGTGSTNIRNSRILSHEVGIIYPRTLFLDIDRTLLQATTVINANGATHIGGSTLSVGSALIGSGTYTCVFTYNTNYLALGTNCL